MSGHSKWATIHRQKEAKDSARGNLFSKLGRAVTIATKTGGGPNPDANFKLRVAIDKARAANMPKENIERAISRASSEGANMEELSYEGFGPFRIGVIVEAVTDNRNRTSQEIKNLFERGGGRLAGPGAVSFNFDNKGVVLVQKKEDAESQILSLIDLGVENVEETEDAIEVFVTPEKLSETRHKVEKAGFEVISAEIRMEPKNYVFVADANEAQKAISFLQSLQEHDDVQRVFANLDIAK